MINRTIQPSVKNATDFDFYLKPYMYFSLDNQLPVYAIDAGKEEVLALEFVFFAGNSFEQKDLLAASTNFLLKNGTAKKNAFQITEYFDYYGAFLNRACYNETATLSLHCLSKHIEQLLPEVATILTDSIFPEEEIEIYKKNAKEKLKVNLQKGDFVANRLIDEYVYGYAHPYGKYTTEQQFDAIQKEDLLAFYKQFYKHGNCLLFVSGKLPKHIMGLLNQYFGQLPLQIVNHSSYVFDYAYQPNQEKIHTIVNDANAVQGAIRIARQFPDSKHPDFTKAQVMNTIFGGYFGSRLMSNIREEKGYTYGIHSFIQSHLKDTALMITTEAGKDVCEATIAEVWKEAAIMREQLVSEQELLLVKNYLLGGVLSNIDGPFQIMNRWKSYILKGVDEKVFYDNIATIKSITPEEVQVMARKYLKEEDFWQLTVY